MSEKFHTELNRLKQDTTEMVQFARDMLCESVNALNGQDTAKALQVVSKKKQIRDVTITLEERTYQLIALYQPMAKDMRVIACTLKMITASERIGRYGKDIAKYGQAPPGPARFYPTTSYTAHGRKGTGNDR